MLGLSVSSCNSSESGSFGAWVTLAFSSGRWAAAEQEWVPEVGGQVDNPHNPSIAFSVPPESSNYRMKFVLRSTIPADVVLLNESQEQLRRNSGSAAAKPEEMPSFSGTPVDGNAPSENGSSDVASATESSADFGYVAELEVDLEPGNYHLVAVSLNQALSGLLRVEAMMYDPDANLPFGDNNIIRRMPMFPPGELVLCRASKLNCLNHPLPPCEEFTPLKLRRDPDDEGSSDDSNSGEEDESNRNDDPCQLSNDCIGGLSAERGDACDSPTALELSYDNVCPEEIVVIYCIRDEDGGFISGVENVDALSPGGRGAYACESAGEYWVNAMRASNYDNCLRGLPTCFDTDPR